MSVKKYKIAREFRKGVAARILGQAINSKCSKDFEAGYSWAGREDCFDILYDALNEYLVSVGEKEISLIGIPEEIGGIKT
jgi:hypothetical protein